MPPREARRAEERGRRPRERGIPRRGDRYGELGCREEPRGKRGECRRGGTSPADLFAEPRPLGESVRIRNGIGTAKAVPRPLALSPHSKGDSRDGRGDKLRKARNAQKSVPLGRAAAGAPGGGAYKWRRARWRRVCKSPAINACFLARDQPFSWRSRRMASISVGNASVKTT